MQQTLKLGLAHLTTMLEHRFRLLRAEALLSLKTNSFRYPPWGRVLILMGGQCARCFMASRYHLWSLVFTHGCESVCSGWTYRSVVAFHGSTSENFRAEAWHSLPPLDAIRARALYHGSSRTKQSPSYLRTHQE